MTGWKTLTLRQAGVELIDCVHKTPAARPEGFPYVAIPDMKSGRIDFSNARRISQSDFVEWTRKAHPRRDDVVLSRRTNPGVTAVDDTGTEFALGQNLVLLRADGKAVHPPFLRWLCRGPEWWGQIEKFLNVGAVFSSLRCGDVPNFEFTIPPLTEQREIASILGALDDKIELNRGMAATLEEMARALYRSWFVDFDPVKAKAEGLVPAFMDEATAALFPDRFGDDGLPEGWRMGCVADVFDVVMGQSPPGNTYNDQGNGLPFYQGRTDFGFRFPSQRVFCSAPTRIAPRDSILLSVRAPVGDLNRAWEECCIGRGVASLSEKEGRNAYGYQALWALSEPLKAFDSEGTVFGAINKNQLSDLSLMVPPKSMQTAFEVRVRPMDDRIRNVTAETRTLVALRDSLLPKLMSGELRVGEAHDRIEEAL